MRNNSHKEIINRNAELIEKIHKNKKKYRIYVIRRLDCNPKGMPHSYCVTLSKKDNCPFEKAIIDFDTCLKTCMPESGWIEYVDRMFSVHIGDAVYNFCLEAYKKSAQIGGYIEDGIPRVYLLHRMGIEQAVHRLKKNSWQSWKKNNDWFIPEKVLDEIKRRMNDPELVENYPNHADRFIASYKVMKENYKYNPSYIKGIL